MPADGAATDDIGLVVALPAEARSIGVRGVSVGGCVRWHHGWVAVSGMGTQRATRAAERLLDCGARCLANWGVAGALGASLASGDVLLPAHVRCRDDATAGFATDPLICARIARQLQDRLRVHRGDLWSSAHAVLHAAEKRQLAERTGAVAIDMEAAPIASVAARAGLPFVALKVICDPLAREWPERIARVLDATDTGISWRMLSAIACGGPATWRAAAVLSRDFRHARDTLATVAQLTT